ncbi:hypothetical protein CBR_g49518 [Chara braunii]|uniref:CCHC-type domain-containing protein n=1 Tax=Chara braunii TaxID=69332 RepID=A0A388M582_CHABU|nr:hypothetical protein CBR_g49518 [Chara braunii]|eukprot:GBG89665.1 hypothetical protein CBR_g49518 [Chara braunii]
MASNVPNSTIVRTCYNCGDPGHFIRWFPHPKPANPHSALIPTQQPLPTLLYASSSNNDAIAINSGAGQFSRGSGWNQAKQRLDYLEHIIAETHDAEVEKEKNMKAEEEKALKEKADEERREAERKEREDFRKSLTDSMNTRLNGVVDVLHNKGNNNEVEALRKEVEKLGGKARQGGASTSFVQGTVHDNDSVLAKLLAKQERMNSQLDEALMAKWRLKLVEKEMHEDLEKAKEKIARMEREMSQKTSRSNLRSKMDEVCTGKGKEKKGKDKVVADEKEKEAFAKDERKSLRGMTKDALMAICDKEGVKYVGVKQTVDDMVAHRVKKAFPPVTVEVSEDLADAVGERSSGGDSVS